MPKKTSDDLYSLIKSLKKTEKSYFKKYGFKDAGRKKNNYIKLFDALCKLPSGSTYDESRIKECFKGTKMVRQFHSSKNYLYNLIIKSMRDYHRNESRTQQIKDLVQNIEILYVKGLYSQCQKMINKAKALAELHEEFLLMLEISSWQKKLITTMSFENSDRQQIDSIFKCDNDTMRQFKNINDLWECSLNLYYSYKKYGAPRDKKSFARFKKYFNSPLLSEKSNALTCKAKLFFLNIKILESNLSNEPETFYTICKEMIELMDNHPEITSQNMNNYVSALGNLLATQVALKKFSEVNNTINKLENISSKSEHINSRIFSHTSTYKMEMFIKTGDFVKGASFVEETEKKMKKHGNFLNDEKLTILYYQAAYINFGASRYNESLKWLNLILNYSRNVFRMDIYCLAKILNLIVHYKLNNYDHLEYAFKSTYRFLFKRNRLYKTESIILYFFRRLMTIKDRESLVELFKELLYEIEVISNDEMEKEFLQYFDAVSWLKSEVENRNYMEVVKERLIC